MHIVPLEAVSRENSITQPGHHQLGTRSSSGERHQANCALRLSQSFIKIPGTARSPTTSSRAQLQAYEMGQQLEWATRGLGRRTVMSE